MVTKKMYKQITSVHGSNVLTVIGFVRLPGRTPKVILSGLSDPILIPGKAAAPVPLSLTVFF